MREGIFIKVERPKKIWDRLAIFAFWVIISFLHFFNFWFTGTDSSLKNSLVVALFTLFSTFPFAWIHTYCLIHRVLGSKKLNTAQAWSIYLLCLTLLVFISSVVFDLLFEGQSQFINIFSIPHPIFQMDGSTHETLTYERTIPETIINILSFAVFVYCVHWYKSNVLLKQENDKQRLKMQTQNVENEKQRLKLEDQEKEIEKSKLEREVLENKDMIHTLLNSFFLQTDAITEIAESLEENKQQKLKEIVKHQENIGKLQRFRYSLIVDNIDFVPMEYEFKALTWMQDIINSDNRRITFVNDIENIEEEKYLIVTNVMSELLWNAFKHSYFKDKSTEVEIVLEIAIIENSIKMYLENPIGDSRSSESGKGLETLRKRLDMGYGTGEYEFSQKTISETGTPDKYIVQLQLPLKEKTSLQ